MDLVPDVEGIDARLAEWVHALLSPTSSAERAVIALEVLRDAYAENLRAEMVAANPALRAPLPGMTDKPEVEYWPPFASLPRGERWRFLAYYYDSPHWRRFRMEVIVYYRGQCQDPKHAGDRYRPSGDLNVHHKHYETLWHETLADVELLCNPCHDGRHDRKVRNLRGPGR